MIARLYRSSLSARKLCVHSTRTTQRMYTGSTPPTISSSQNVTLPFIAELYDPNFLDTLLPPGKEGILGVTAVEDDVSLKNPMMEALRSTTSQTLTENEAPAYSSTGSATLDAFQGLNKYTFGLEVNNHLDRSWREDPALTLRIIWNLRSIHDGKREKEAFYRAFGWLYDNHPRTAIQNLHLLVAPVCTRPKVNIGAAHGYWKDLLNIVTLASLDQLSAMDGPAPYLHSPRHEWQHNHVERLLKLSKEERIAAANEKAVLDKALAKHRRAIAAAELHEHLIAKLEQPKFRALYIAVARLFAERLAKDIAIIKEIELLPADSNPVARYKQISLAAKWAPTPHGSHDRHTNLATAIASLLHHAQVTVPLSVPVHSDVPYSNLESLVLRSFYQRWILTTIRKASLVTEPLMSANRWKEIRYTRVSSLCMNNNMEHFYAHDPEGFEEYLIAVEEGKKKISGATLMPHELVRQAIELGGLSDEFIGKSAKNRLVEQKLAKIRVRVVEAQWTTMIERLQESGSLDNSIAICDVSGSMGSLHSHSEGRVRPIYPAISLSLVLAQLAKPPFNNAFITFSHKPKFHQIDPSQGLVETVYEMSRADWEMNTNLNAVFIDLLLPLAVKHKVKQEDMIKRLFVFSDMQFDSGAGTNADPAHWETNHDAIEKAYTAAGYEMPEIVYWNLMDRANATTPVKGERKGVALMSGFSPTMLKVMMGEIDPEDAGEWEDVKDEAKPVKEKAVFDPISVMKKVLLRKSYGGLVVVD
jgi:hypothetical protein